VLTADNAELKNRAYLQNLTQMNIMQQDYLASVNEAGTDNDKVQGITAQFQDEVRTLTLSAPPSLQDKLVYASQEYFNSSNEIGRKAQLTYDTGIFNDDMSSAAYNWGMMDADTKLENIEEFKIRGQKLGYTTKQIMETFKGQAISSIVANIDQEQLINNRDYDVVRKLRDDIQQLQDFDTNDVEFKAKTNELLTKTKNLVDAAVISDVKDDISRLDFQALNNHIDTGLNNEAFNESEAITYYSDYVKAAYDPSKMAIDAANAMPLSTPKEFIADQAIQTAFAKRLHKEMVTKLQTNELTEDELKTFQNFNYSTYSSVTKQLQNSLISQFEGITQDSKKTPEEIKASFDRAQVFYQRHKSGLDTPTIIKFKTAQYLMQNGTPQQLGEYYRSINDRGGMKLIPASNKDIKPFLEELPVTEQDEARTYVSALVTIGVDMDAAKDIVREGYGSTTLNSSDQRDRRAKELGVPSTGMFEGSTPFKQNLYNIDNVIINNTTLNKLKEDGLLNANDLYMTLIGDEGQNILSSEIKERARKVTVGENPTITIENNILTIKNKTKTGGVQAVFRYPLDAQSRQQMIQASNDYTLSNTQENRVSRVVKNVSKTLYEKVGDMTQETLDGISNEIDEITTDNKTPWYQRKAK